MGGVRRDPEVIRDADMRKRGGIRNAGDHVAADKLLMLLSRSGLLPECY